MYKPKQLTAAIAVLAALAPAGLYAAESYPGYGYEPTKADHIGEKEYSPYLNIGYPQRVFWGDTHLHTSYSTDAGMIGNKLGPEEAYRFALGEMVTSSTGVRTRLQRPLDFLVVADHAENLGLAPMIEEKNPDLLKTDFGKEISDLVNSGKYLEAYKLWGEGMEARKDPLAGNDDLTRTLWERITAAAESRRGRYRVFAFGVGHDVNTRLLDRLSEATRGTTQYVEPGEDVERALSLLAARLAEDIRKVLELIQLNAAGAINAIDVQRLSAPIEHGQNVFGVARRGGEHGQVGDR